MSASEKKKESRARYDLKFKCSSGQSRSRKTSQRSFIRPSRDAIKFHRRTERIDTLVFTSTRRVIKK